MIKYFVRKVHDRVGMIPRPRMLLGIPSGVTEVEKRAVRDAAERRRSLGSPHRGADGRGDRRRPAGQRPSGSLVVDVGGGTTEVAVISLGGIVVSRSIRIGGDEMDQDIVAFARREYNLFLGGALPRTSRSRSSPRLPRRLVRSSSGSPSAAVTS